MKGDRLLIKRPLVSEKIALLQGETKSPFISGKGEWYAFEVDTKANKISIKNAVEELYSAQGIKVVKVRTLNCRGRRSRFGRHLSDVNYWKKALVQLAEGQSLSQV